MGTKKINPANPDTKATKSDDKGKSVDRKSSVARSGRRKSAAMRGK